MSNALMNRPPPSVATGPVSTTNKLSVENLSLRFGGIVAINSLNFQVREGAICGLIGPNGAGKTSTFNCVSRLYNPTSGTIKFDGNDITRLKAKDTARIGIARTFQNLALMKSLTVLENVMLGGYCRYSTGLLRAPWVPTSMRSEEAALRKEAVALLERLELSHLRNDRVDSLPYPTLKRIELARALALRPSFVMLDEPAGGLSHSEVDELALTLQRVRDDFGLTMLLVEHHMGMVMNLTDDIVVLDFGSKIAEGKPEAVKRDPRVVEAYLGRKRERS